MVDDRRDGLMFFMTQSKALEEQHISYWKSGEQAEFYDNHCIREAISLTTRSTVSSLRDAVYTTLNMY